MSSAVINEATRIARLFDYPTEQVHRGVAEYKRQMDEGLSQEHTTLSQIPTFVTSVPNGTEKVCCLAWSGGDKKESKAKQEMTALIKLCRKYI